MEPAISLFYFRALSCPFLYASGASWRSSSFFRQEVVDCAAQFFSGEGLRVPLELRGGDVTVLQWFNLVSVTRCLVKTKKKEEDVYQDAMSLSSMLRFLFSGLTHMREALWFNLHSQVTYIKVSRDLPNIYIEENRGIFILPFKITAVGSKTLFQPVPPVG